MGYPETEGFAYSFQRGELWMNGKCYVGISGVEFDQPTEEGAVMGTRSGPLKRTVGEMGLGEGTVTFSDEEERMRFLADLGDAFREQTWSLTWILTAPNKPNVKLSCKGCRVLSNPFSHESGSDGLGGDIGFSAMHHTVNGKAPHSGLRA